jgi:Zn-dependent protease
MRASFKLGKICGIPIRINYTWFLIFILVAASLAVDSAGYGYPPIVYVLVGVLGSLLFFGSVLAHELAHSLVARAQGVPVRDITLFLFGGVSSIEQEVDRPLRELLMAGVGPATSLVLGLAFGLLALLLAPLNALASAFFVQLAVVNAGLALFNLLPGLPLDGGRVLRALIWQATRNYRRATGIASMAGRAVSFLLIGGGILWTYLSWMDGQLNLNGLWLALIGWFMDNAAIQSYQQAVLQEALRGVTVANLMSRECSHIPRSLSVTELVDFYVLRQGGRCFLVTEGEALVGIVTMHNIRDLPRERWPYTPVGEIMVAHQSLAVAQPHEDAWTVLRRMDERNVNQLPVAEDGRLLGLLTRENLLRYVRARAELKI